MFPDPERQNLEAQKPYLIVHHPPTGHSAAFSREYQLMFEACSAELLAHVTQHHTQKDRGFILSFPQQQPSWMRDSLRGECLCYYSYSERTPTAEIAAIPAR